MSLENQVSGADHKKTMVGSFEAPVPEQTAKPTPPDDWRQVAAEQLRNGAASEDMIAWAKATLLSEGYRWDDAKPEQSFKEMMAIIQRSPESKAQQSYRAYLQKQEDDAQRSEQERIRQEIAAAEDIKRKRLQAELIRAQGPSPYRAPLEQKPRGIKAWLSDLLG